jgi:hypothetical protein
MIENARLETYWITFPKNPNLPMAIGVTAYSVADVFQLIEEQNISSWFTDASELSIRCGIRFEDIDIGHVSPNMGPMQLRGVWYPAMNIGYGSPRDASFIRLDKAKE